MDNSEKIIKIADIYGYDAQSRQCIEEMAELTQAINKFWRKRYLNGTNSISISIYAEDEYYYNLVEEIADVQIMLWQMLYLLSADVQPVSEQKLDRQLERIEKE